jgi:hypothetical protein
MIESIAFSLSIKAIKFLVDEYNKQENDDDEDDDD